MRTLMVALGLCALLCAVAGAENLAPSGIFTTVTKDGNVRTGSVAAWQWHVTHGGWNYVGEHNTWEQQSTGPYKLRWAHSSQSGEMIEIDTLSWYAFRSRAYIDNEFWYSELSEPYYYKHPWYYTSIELPLTRATPPGPPTSNPTQD
ncbi:MAG TPA: hypothetical protein ENN51_04780 [candidate division WOR-3 bacterium]|uniref:Uncharacterized protein n=1 Tax=candidate division WOR-3 bacterium TaxID=2052148 RepID=A0A7V0T619_UNCW3|nr:hypothetical protein [candidate division WOR-3 bacterium]